MANKNTQGFGFRPAMRVGNTPAIQGQSKYEIDAGDANAIFNGEPVKVNIHAATGGYITTAARYCNGWSFKWCVLHRWNIFKTNFQ